MAYFEGGPKKRSAATAKIATYAQDGAVNGQEVEKPKSTSAISETLLTPSLFAYRDAGEILKRSAVFYVVVANVAVLAASRDAIAGGCERKSVDRAAADLELRESLAVFGFENSDFAAEGTASDGRTVRTERNRLNR